MLEEWQEEKVLQGRVPQREEEEEEEGDELSGIEMDRSSTF